MSNHLDKLERREQSLMAKCELQEGRLSQSDASSRPSSGRSRSGMGAGRSGSYGGGMGGGGGTSLGELKAKQLRQKKERLSYAVDRLTLQAQQRERQLRMSMAAPQ